MENDRSVAITIGGQEYRLVLTTKATKEIARRYGGLENLGIKLMKTENFELALDEIVWLITLLANQSVLIDNRLNGEKRSLLTEDDVELLSLIHISEPTRLGMISYAVFCLKKKT